MNPNLLTQTAPRKLSVLRNAGSSVPPHGAAQVDAAVTTGFVISSWGIQDIIVCRHSGYGAIKGRLQPPLNLDFPVLTRRSCHTEAPSAEGIGTPQGLLGHLKAAKAVTRSL